MAKIMIQGTGSTVGKSILVAALCRIFKQDGYSVCPYKSQNMALNSYITLDGKEMGRAQVLQAYAAGLEPEVYMNPILLKPTSDRRSQVIVDGKVYGNFSAVEYHNLKLEFKEMLKEGFDKLEDKFDIIVMEGAGSPAEINLRDRDIVNMGMAELVDAPVLLVGDIDKGGVFASLAGTMLLLREEEKPRVKGTIINKFRGDLEILKPGLTMLEDIINKPCLGVIPYFKLKLEDEDGAMMEINKKALAPIDVAVIMLTHMSNFTDFDALMCEKDVSVRYITSKEEFGCPDLLIIPGSKNTIEDLHKIREYGLVDKIIEYGKTGLVIGICGGYQMLGLTIKDPYHVESDMEEIKGIGLLGIDTIFERDKKMTRVKLKCTNEHFDIDNDLYGYEIHMGRSIYKSNAKALFNILEENGEKVNYEDGAVNSSGNIFGTYVHGIFDGKGFRQFILNKLRKSKGLALSNSPTYENERENELDKLADLVRANINIEEIYKIMFNKES